MAGAPRVDQGGLHADDRLVVRATSLAAIGAGSLCWLLVMVDWGGPVRGVLAVTFLLVGPGAVLASLMKVREPFLWITVATSASVAMGTLVAVSLLYARHFSAGWAIGLLVLITAGLAVTDEALARHGATRRVSEVPRS